ncbi:hypothetical protein K438DRAFT_476881 [Mycena galopus ATCC 62051]|nr:hypothetical protein K438DRAFT_476881 [Mycena galopus ATCC 62051]
MNSVDGEDILSPTASSFSPVDDRHHSFYCDEGQSLEELLRELKTNCAGLERQLEMFASSVRQLGSSLGLYKGSREFHRQLSNVRQLLEDESQIELLVVNTFKPYPAATRVHGNLSSLVDSLAVFSTAWEDFPEFTPEHKHHFDVLEQDLLVWLNILGCYEYSPEFLRCARELLFDTISELDHVTHRLIDFIATVSPKNILPKFF